MELDNWCKDFSLPLKPRAYSNDKHRQNSIASSKSNGVSIMMKNRFKGSKWTEEDEKWLCEHLGIDYVSSEDIGHMAMLELKQIVAGRKPCKRRRKKKVSVVTSL